MNIGESVRMRRVQLKMTQTDLSRKTGIKQPTISAIENGVNKPAIETIVLISDALNCTVSDLVGQTMPAPQVDPFVSRLLSVFRQLNDSGKQLLLQQAESILSQPALRQEGPISKTE